MTPNIQKSRAHVQVKSFAPAGKWNPQVCEDLIAHSRQGLSFAAFAGVAGVSRKTLYKWLDKHPDFRAAKDLADGLSLLAWEKIGIGLATGKLKGSGVAFIHQICNRFPDLYRQRIEKQEIELSGSVNIGSLADALKDD